MRLQREALTTMALAAPLQRAMERHAATWQLNSGISLSSLPTTALGGSALEHKKEGGLLVEGSSHEMVQRLRGQVALLEAGLEKAAYSSQHCSVVNEQLAQRMVTIENRMRSGGW